MTLSRRLLLWLCLNLLLTACAGVPTPLPSAQALLDQSAQAMQALRSAHFVVERTGAPAYVDEGNTLIFRRAEGDFATPDQARAAVRVIGAAFVADVNVVALGDRYWETNPLTGAWGNYSGFGYNPAALFNPETGLPALMRLDLTNLRLVGVEQLEDFPGEKLFHLAAEAPGEHASAMTAGLVGRGRVTLEWWIQPQTGYTLRLRVVEPETDPKDPTVWVVDFDSFDKPVTLTPPAP
jgi:hypothetical protein